MPDRTDVDLAARAIRCPSWCTADPSHLDSDRGEGGVLHGHVELPATTDQRSAGSSARVWVSQYVGLDGDVLPADVFLSIGSGDFGDAVELKPDEALKVALALVEARELAQQGSRVRQRPAR